MFLAEAPGRVMKRCVKIKKTCEFTFIISGEGKPGHRLQAVSAAHYQRTGASVRLGGTGGGPGAKAKNSKQKIVELIDQLIEDLLSCRPTNSTTCLLYYEYFVFSVFHLKRAKIRKRNKNKEE